MWEKVGSISGKRKPGEQEGEKQYGHSLRSRRGFRYNVREEKARPSNTTVRELMGNYAYAEAILSFLRETDEGKVKAGVLDRGAGQEYGLDFSYGVSCTVSGHLIYGYGFSFPLSFFVVPFSYFLFPCSFILQGR